MPSASRTTEGLKELPVILLTSLSDPKDILKGLECGADNFIVKPYDEEFLLSRIQYVLANLELRRQSAGKPATEIFFAGHKYQLTSERIHSIDLLLSTYETAVQKNLELSKAKEVLEEQALAVARKQRADEGRSRHGARAADRLPAAPLPGLSRERFARAERLPVLPPLSHHHRSSAAISSISSRWATARWRSSFAM